MADHKHPGAVALGKRRMENLTQAEREELGRKGGQGRRKKLTKARRKEIAKKAAQARWGKKAK